MRKGKMLFLNLFLLLVISFCTQNIVKAEKENDMNIVSITDGRAYEETQWYYRTVNGIRQKRLWSITEGHWIGEWISIS